MPQTTNSIYDNLMADMHKAVDFMFVISGWPTVYTVAAGDYSLTGDVSDFDSIQQWADIPSFSQQKTKGRPEDAGVSFATMEVSLLDVVDAGQRHIGDLQSRFAYLIDQNSGPETELSSAISDSATSIPVGDTSGFPSSGRIWISRECIEYDSKTSTSFESATRRALLTDSWAHAKGVRVYGYMPALERRLVFLYKGTRDLPLSQWVKAFGGILTDQPRRDGFKVRLSAADQYWETWLSGVPPMILNPWHRPHDQNDLPHIGELGNDFFGYDEEADAKTRSTAGSLDSGHIVAEINGEYMAISAVS